MPDIDFYSTEPWKLHLSVSAGSESGENSSWLPTATSLPCPYRRRDLLWVEAPTLTTSFNFNYQDTISRHNCLKSWGSKTRCFGVHNATIILYYHHLQINILQQKHIHCISRTLKMRTHFIINCGM